MTDEGYDKFNEAMEAEQDLIDDAIISHAAKMRWLRSCPEHSEVSGEGHLDTMLDLYMAAHDFIDACDAAGLYELIDGEEGHDVFWRVMGEEKKS